MKQSLPGIKAISFLPCHLLAPHILEKHRAGVPIAVFSPATPIEHYGNSSCEAESEYVNGGYIEKTVLQFTTTDELPTSQPLAFLVMDANDHSFLIGLREAPFPIVESVTKVNSETNVKEVKVSFQRFKSLISCNV